jgi:predicted metalloprotease with PDZ domain
MKRILSTILVLCIFLSSVAFSNFHKENKSFAVRYTLDATGLENGSVKMTIDIMSFSDTVFRLETFKPHPEAVDFSDLKASGADAKDLVVKSVGSSGCSQNYNKSWGCEVWQINNGKNTNFSISYMAKPGYDPDHFSDAQIGRIEEDFIMFSGYSVFLVPKTTIPFQVNVNFIVPESWETYTTWEKTIDGYTPTGPSKDIRENLNYSGFVSGKGFQVINKNIGGCETQILVSDDFSAKNSQEIIDELLFGFEYQTKMFGSAPADRYLVVVTKSGNVRYFSMEWLTSQERARNPESGIPEYDPMLHGSHHRWNGWVNGNWDVNQSTKWLHEGTADYYAVKIPYRFSTQVHANGFKNDEIRYYQETLKAQNVAVVAQNIDSMVYYRQGALVISLLDYEITKRTEGEKTFDDFYGHLFQKYSAFANKGKARECSNSCVMNELNKFTESDFSEFFKDHVYGKEIPIDWLTADEDGDGLFTYDEILLSTDPTKPDTDGDGVSDMHEKQAGSNPLVQE